MGEAKNIYFTCLNLYLLEKEEGKEERRRRQQLWKTTM